MRQTMLVNYNVPVRIGKAIAMPGDVVLAKRGGVLFIPPHLVEHIVLIAEFTRLSDEFGEEMIKAGVYTAGQIDSAWNDEMNKRFGNGSAHTKANFLCLVSSSRNISKTETSDRTLI